MIYVTRPDFAKIDKQAALYTYRDETSYMCKDCAFWKNKKCALFHPSVEIKAYGSCNMWIANHIKVILPYFEALSKEEAGYMENDQGFSCKRCEYFIVGANDCKRVKKASKGDTPGMIHPDACCSNWEVDAERGSKTDAEFKGNHENTDTLRPTAGGYPPAR